MKKTYPRMISIPHAEYARLKRLDARQRRAFFYIRELWKLFSQVKGREKFDDMK